MKCSDRSTSSNHLQDSECIDAEIKKYLANKSKLPVQPPDADTWLPEDPPEPVGYSIPTSPKILPINKPEKDTNSQDIQRTKSMSDWDARELLPANGTHTNHVHNGNIPPYTPHLYSNHVFSSGSNTLDSQPPSNGKVKQPPPYRPPLLGNSSNSQILSTNVENRPNDEKLKKLKSLKKILRQIEELLVIQQEGTQSLNEDQLKKLSRKQEVEEEIKQLELHL